MASPHQQRTTIHNLPNELLSEILIRVPAKPLAQMRCVSKPWNAILSQPSFIKSHLHRFIKNNDEILLVLSDGDLFHLFSVTTPFSRSPHLELTDLLKPPVVLSRPVAKIINFVGSVNGLICFCYQLDSFYTAFVISTDNFDIRIWNPSLSTALTLPRCQLPYRNIYFNNVYFRFAYDPKTDDYKLVKLMCRSQEWLQVEVYSLRKDSWHLITQRFPSHVTEIFNEDKVCVDGCDGRLHWLGYVGEGRKPQTIVAFDLCMETFSELSLPQSVVHHNERSWDSLGVMDGKLCVMSCNKNFECEVWVMNEYGVAESWVKHNLLSDLSGVVFPYGFTSSNKFLFATHEHGFVMYDPISADTEVMGSQIWKIKVVRYVESLVWMPRVTE